MPKRDEPQIRRHELVLSILAYLLEHPDARDTAEGVIRWWLPHEDPMLDVSEVLEGLEYLVSKGWVVANTVAGSTVIYGTRKDHLQCIDLYVKEATKQARRRTG